MDTFLCEGHGKANDSKPQTLQWKGLWAMFCKYLGSTDIYPQGYNYWYKIHDPSNITFVNANIGTYLNIAYVDIVKISQYCLQDTQPFFGNHFNHYTNI